MTCMLVIIKRWRFTGCYFVSIHECGLTLCRWLTRIRLMWVWINSELTVCSGAAARAVVDKMRSLRGIGELFSKLLFHYLFRSSQRIRHNDIIEDTTSILYAPVLYAVRMCTYNEKICIFFLLFFYSSLRPCQSKLYIFDVLRFIVCYLRFADS